MDRVELRCPQNQLLGVLVDGRLEIRCRNLRCGYKPGVLVVHRFDPMSGSFIDTKKYQDPNNQFNRSKEAAPCR